MRRRLLLLAAALLVGCPEERPGVERRIPGERVPAALSVDPAPYAGGSPAPDAGGLPSPDAGGPLPADGGARR